MPGGNVDIRFTGDDAQVLSAYQRQNAEQRKQIENLEKIAHTSRRAGDAHQEAGSRASSAVRDFATSIIGVASATQAINLAARTAFEEIQKIRRLQAESAGTQTAAGGSFRRLLTNFSPDETLGRDQLQGRLQQISTQTRTDFNLVSEAFGAASSAKGDLTNEQAAQAVQASFSLLPGDQSFGVDFSGRLLDLAKLSGESPQANAGFLRSLQQKARIQDPSKLGASATPAIGSVVAAGGTVEEGGELFATLNSLLADVEGSITKTAVANLSARLSAFEGGAQFTAATGPAARLAVLQQNPALAERFLAENPFGAESGAAVGQLVRGDARALATLRDVQAGVVAPSAQTAEDFNAFVGGLEQASFQPVRNLGEGVNVAIQGFELSDIEGAQTAQVRQALAQTLQKINFRGPDALTSGEWFGTIPGQFDLLRQQGRSPAEAGIEAVDKIRDSDFAFGASPQEVQRNRKLLEDLRGLFTQLRDSSAPSAPLPVQIVPSGPPSGDLSRTN